MTGVPEWLAIPWRDEIYHEPVLDTAARWQQATSRNPTADATPNPSPPRDCH